MESGISSSLGPGLGGLLFGGGPFVPVPKKWLLAYQPEERKRRSVSDLVGKLYELDQ